VSIARAALGQALQATPRFAELHLPQRIIYQRQPEGSLHARIEGALNGKTESMDWHYRCDAVLTLRGPVI
jgi:hypothetical protein